MSGNAHAVEGLYLRNEAGGYVSACDDVIVEMARAVAMRRVVRSNSFADPSTAQGFFRDKLGGLEREVFAVALLDTRHRMIRYEEMFQGTIDGAEVHPREVVKAALKYNAAAVIVAHNHPSGVVDCSAADRAVTSRLKQALALVDIRLLDHIIVAGNHAASMAANGLV